MALDRCRSGCEDGKPKRAASCLFQPTGSDNASCTTYLDLEAALPCLDEICDEITSNHSHFQLVRVNLEQQSTSVLMLRNPVLKHQLHPSFTIYSALPNGKIIV
jgi:hypothetical protein